MQYKILDVDELLPSVAEFYIPGAWAKLNGANAVFFVVLKNVLENFDNCSRRNNSSFLRTLRSIKIN